MNEFKPMGAVAFALGAALCAYAALPAFADGVAVAAVSSNKAAASQVDKIAGSSLSKVTLTQKSAERLDIKTGKVGLQDGVVTAPYAALLYDVKGKTWVYTNPSPLVYVRAPVVVDSIKGANALLKEGPPEGTVVVVVGVAELYGAESGIGKK